MTARKKIILGDTTPDLAKLGREHGAQGVYSHNIEQAKHHTGCYFVSLGDVELRHLLDLLDTADEIILQDKANWSTRRLQIMSEAVVRYYSHRVRGEYKLPPPWSYVEHYARNSDRMIWAFGGSTMQGAGLDHPETESFAAKLCAMLPEYTATNTAKRGTGLRRSVEILIHSDPQPQDIIVLDVVVPQRLRINQDGYIQDVFLANSGREWVTVMSDDQVFYDHVSYLDIFVKQCRTIGCRLIFFNHQHQDDMWFRCIERFSTYPEWCWLERIDTGNDGHHPGPKTHALWANKILDRIQA